MPDILDSFIDKKKSNSVFISLVDGESVKVLKLKDIKQIMKAGFGGEEEEVLRFYCIVETPEGAREKTFDNKTQRFAKELKDKGVKVGSAFTLTRSGTSTKTRYIISDVVTPTEVSSATTVAPKAVAPAAPTGMASVGEVISQKDPF